MYESVGQTSSSTFIQKRNRVIKLLDNYIDIAKSELTNINKVVDNLLEVRVLNLQKKKQQYLNNIGGNEISMY